MRVLIVLPTASPAVLAASILGCLLAAQAPNQGFAWKGDVPVPVLTSLPDSMHEVAEMSYRQRAEPLPNGTAVVRGLYGEFGGHTFKVCRTEGHQLRCRSYPLELDTRGPLLIELSCTVYDGRLAAQHWRPLDWDEDAQRRAVRQELNVRAAFVVDYDWSRVARADFRRSSASLEADAAQFTSKAIQLFGYDTDRERIVWRIEGPQFPPERELVYRFPVIYVFTEPSAVRAPGFVLTIEGYVLE